MKRLLFKNKRVLLTRYAAKHTSFSWFFWRKFCFIFVIRGVIRMLTFLLIWLVSLGINWKTLSVSKWVWKTSIFHAYAIYTDSLKHKPMTDSPWLAIYDNHGFDPCNKQPTCHIAVHAHLLFVTEFWECVFTTHTLYPDTGDQCSQLIVATLVPSTPICLFFNLAKLHCKQTVLTDFCI